MMTSLAIQKKNQTLMENDEGSGDEDLEPEDGPPTKRAHKGKGKVVLDSEEAAFARSLPFIFPTPGATSQYKDMEVESQDEGAENELQEPKSDQGDTDIENGGDNNDQGLGFLDNGICLQSF